MDKLHNTIARNVKHKQGFALILTLSVLSVVIALTSVLLGYFEQVQKEATQTKALIQANLYYTDVKKVLNKKKDHKAMYKDFLYTSAVPLISPDGRFSLILDCSPLAKGININWMGVENNQKLSAQNEEAETLFERIVERYQLSDGEFLHTLILEQFSKEEKKFVQNEQSRLRQKNGIISFTQFKKLLQRYQFEVDDPNIAKVPWDELFVFNPISEESALNVIDANYLSVKLIALLFEIEPTVIEGYQEGNTIDLARLVKEQTSEVLNVKLYSKNFVPMTECEVTYQYVQERFMFKFIDIQGEVKNFEFYGKQ